jgi:hypothetical protein
MADTISFYAADMTFKGDKEGQGKVGLVISAMEVEKVAAFYARNYGKRLGIAITVDESNVGPVDCGPDKEVGCSQLDSKTGEIKEG